MCETIISSFRANAEEARRLKEIEEHEYRNKFQRDRDRILYSKEFRRLSGKTQIFVTGSDDNMRTRLTHTLEVAQIAETISDKLGLDSILTRAIAYGHDIGHTPFGHVGERTLNYIMNGCYPYYHYNDQLTDEEKGFKHNLQGVRVACSLEESLDQNNHLVKGLNLTTYTLWGIQNHSSLVYKECEYCKRHNECRYKNNGKKCDGKLSVGYYKNLPYKADDREDWTFEGIIVAYADEIAQRHHDIEDGIYAGIINIDHLCDFIIQNHKLEGKLSEAIKNYKENKDLQDNNKQEVGIQILSRAIINYYVTEYSEGLEKKVGDIVNKFQINKTGLAGRRAIYDAIRTDKPITKLLGFEDDMKEADSEFHNYLQDHILNSYVAQCMDGKASYIIKQLVKAYLTNPQQLPDKTIISIVDDWYQSYGVEENNEPYMTMASKSRERLKSIMNKDDLDIRAILLRRICDFIAGMTDQFAMNCFERLYGTKGYEYR